MKWLEKWLTRRQVKNLKEKIQQIQDQAKAAEQDRLALTACTVTHRVRLLQQAVEKIELRESANLAPRH